MASSQDRLTVPAAALSAGDVVYCEAEAYDGASDVGGDTHSSLRTSPTRRVICPAGSGRAPSCPASSCGQAVDDGHLQDSGPLWVSVPGQVGETWCEVGLAGGGWNLAAIVADDGEATWTWQAKDLWESAAPFGPGGRLDRDRKTVVFGYMGVRDLLVVHEPSGVWGHYADVGSGADSLATLLADAQTPCPGSGDGFELTSGSLEEAGDLCGTTLFFHPRDHGGVDDCGAGPSDAWGPAWSTGAAETCPFDAPGAAGSLGPDQADPSGESPALGFGDALGLNTGEPGTGDNRVLLFVRPQGASESPSP